MGLQVAVTIVTRLGIEQMNFRQIIARKASSSLVSKASVEHAISGVISKDYWTKEESKDKSPENWKKPKQ